MTRATLPMLLVLAAACRPDPGTPSYPDVSGDSGTVDDGGLPGDNPFDGSPRLTYGVFYEGGATDALVVDDSTINYYNYENSFTQLTDADDYVEGFSADRLIVQNGAANGFWGGGVHFDGVGNQDLSAWTTLNVALKSEDKQMETFELGMNGGGESRVAVSDYGFTADGEWHFIDIPLADLNISLDQVSVGLVFIGIPAVDDTSILIDDLYLSIEESR